MTDLTGRLIEEWPAVLAILVLAVSHVLLVVVLQEDVTPFGFPLIAAIAVFLIAEASRRLYRR